MGALAQPDAGVGVAHFTCCSALIPAIVLWPWLLVCSMRQPGCSNMAARAWGTTPLATGVNTSVQVLTWSAFSANNFGGNNGAAQTVTATYDPVSGTVSTATVTVTNHDMFCPGITMLGSGDIVVTGGSNAEKTSIYDVLTNQWKPGPNMIRPRGYQASALLSTGEVCFGATSSHIMRCWCYCSGSRPDNVSYVRDQNGLACRR
jgi:hypothetical protein